MEPRSTRPNSATLRQRTNDERMGPDLNQTLQGGGLGGEAEMKALTVPPPSFRHSHGSSQVTGGRQPAPRTTGLHHRHTKWSLAMLSRVSPVSNHAMTRSPWILFVLLLAMGCPVRPMPCNGDGDCDYPRNACDTTKPVGDARGTCVWRPLARQGRDSEPSSSSSSSGASSTNATSTSTECAAPCAPGQRCINNLCVCDVQSCQGGCCHNNQCNLVGFTSCGEKGNTCLGCDDARADNCSTAGECRCSNGPICSAGQLCIRGRCECYPPACAGCCHGGECRERSAEACGVNGSVCVGCNPIKADGCSPEGLCRCGRGPPCGLYKACISGNCVCDTERCVGCCDNRVCTLSSMVACGAGGGQCQQCNPESADACNEEGECVCGTGPTCAEGQACIGGQCVCNQQSCKGCCHGNTCESGTSDQMCGTAGLGCEACVDGELCTGGVCTRCNATTCPGGCCSANTCYAQEASTCGTGGKACGFCSPLGADGCHPDGSCGCGAGPACAEGQACISGSCTCSPASCPHGCCWDGECHARAPESCGVNGATCTVCDANATDYCSPEGVCQCGSDAPCSTGLRCIDGSCICDEQSCQQGCCLGDECVVASLEACGTHGGLCIGCNTELSDTCTADGTCSCGNAAACLPGTLCESGACTCTAASCPAGCCANGVCIAVTREACGISGSECVDCGTSADRCGPAGACLCGMGSPCLNDEFCLDGRCVAGGTSSTSQGAGSAGTSTGASAHSSGDSASTSSEGPSSVLWSSSSGAVTSSGASSFAPSGSTSSGSPSSASVDTTPPDMPVVSVPSPTNHARPTWSWVSGGGGNGNYRYKLDDANLTIGATETGQPAYTPSTDLGEGTHTLYVQERDDAGNWSGNGHAEVLIDLTPPDPPALATSNPLSPANQNTPAITGVAEEGSTVALYGNDRCTGTMLATGSAAELAEPGLVVMVSDDSQTSLHATATDTAGNVSGCSTSNVFYVEDSTPPALVILAASNPSSPSNGNTPRILGTAESGSTVKLYTDSACNGEVAATGAAEVFGAVGLEVVCADDSATIFHATATDAAGNTSACSTSILTYVEDSTPPVLVTFTGSTPSSPSSDNSPTITGTAEAGSTVMLYTNSSCTSAVAATGSAAAFMAIGLTVAVQADSTTTFYATAMDTADNVSPCSTASLVYVEDSTSPSPPEVFIASPTSNPQPTWTWVSGGGGNGT